MKTLNLRKAAAFLHMHPEEVRTRAKRGLIPGAKIGRRWVFIEIDLAEFVRTRPLAVSSEASSATGEDLRFRKHKSVQWIEFDAPNDEGVRRSIDSVSYTHLTLPTI